MSEVKVTTAKGEKVSKATKKVAKETEVLYVTQQPVFDMRISGYSPSQKLSDGRLVFRFKKKDMERLKNHFRIKNGELLPYEE